jgi:hypothetical protein
MKALGGVLSSMHTRYKKNGERTARTNFDIFAGTQIQK